MARQEPTPDYYAIDDGDVHTEVDDSEMSDITQQGSEVQEHRMDIDDSEQEQTPRRARPTPVAVEAKAKQRRVMTAEQERVRLAIVAAVFEQTRNVERTFVARHPDTALCRAATDC